MSSRGWPQPSPTLARGQVGLRGCARTRHDHALDLTERRRQAPPPPPPYPESGVGAQRGEDGGRPPGVSSPGASGSRSASRGPPARILRLPQPPPPAGGWGAEWTRGHPLGARGRWPRQRETCRSGGIHATPVPAGRSNRKSLLRGSALAGAVSSCLVHALPRLLPVCRSPLLSPSPNEQGILSTLRGFSRSRICKPPGFRGASHPPHASTSPCPSVLKRFVLSFLFCRTPDLTASATPCWDPESLGFH